MTATITPPSAQLEQRTNRISQRRISQKADALRLYRQYVSQLARDAKLADDEQDGLIDALDVMNLTHADLDADVKAMRKHITATDRLAEEKAAEPQRRKEAEALSVEVEKLEATLKQKRERLDRLAALLGAVTGTSIDISQMEGNNRRLFADAEAFVETLERPRTLSHSSLREGWGV